MKVTIDSSDHLSITKLNQISEQIASSVMSLKSKYVGCQISIGDRKYSCDRFRSREKNMRGAWLLLWVDYGGEYLPKSRDEFERMGGKVSWFYSH